MRPDGRQQKGPLMKIAIPTMGAGGLDCERSGHFGHCDCFTVVTVEDGKIVATGIIDNPPHEEGGCLSLVGILADAGIDAIVAVGMGMRPMMGFAEAGITVLYDAETPRVGDVAEKAAAGALPAMGEEHACHH